MEEIIRALELKKQLDLLRPLEKEQEARIMQKFRLDWNYHSNNLEGNSLTYGETKALIMHGITAQGKPLKDHFEITGHNEAINWIIDVVKGDYPLTESFIRGLHEILLKDLYEEKKKKGIQTGPYKSTGNHVITQTEETLYFATPEETPAEMAALMEWYGEKSRDINFNPILLAAEFHYKFIRIHPFDDGNGRTARLLMNFILMKFGYPPIIIKTEDKSNYLRVLQMADSGNLEAFTEYIAKNLNHSLNIMIAGANGEDIEEPDDIDKEIALLERRLTGIGENALYFKSVDNIKELLEDNINTLILSILDKGKSIFKYYEDRLIAIVIPDNNGTNHDFFTVSQLIEAPEELEDEKRVLLYFNFKNFTAFGLDKFDYILILKFDLLEKVYRISDVNDKLIFQKQYHLLWNQEEIDKIAIAEIKRHNVFIEQKIAEKEKDE